MPRFNAGRIYDDRGVFLGVASPGQTSDEALAALGLRIDPHAPGGVASVNAPAAPVDTSSLEARLAALEAAQAAGGETKGDAGGQ